MPWLAIRACALGSPDSVNEAGINILDSEGAERRSNRRADVVLVLVVAGASTAAGLLFMARHPVYSLRTADAEGPRLEQGFRLPRVPGYEWRSHDKTLVLALRVGCPYCEASMDFYGRLVEIEKQGKGGVHVLAIYQEQAESISLGAPDLPRSLATLPDISFSKLRILSTPTVVLVDSSGVAQSVWRGRLSPELENQLLLAVWPAAGRGTTNDSR